MEDFHEREFLACFASGMGSSYKDEYNKLLTDKRFSSAIICPHDVLREEKINEISERYYSEDFLHRMNSLMSHYRMGFDTTTFDDLQVPRLDRDVGRPLGESPTKTQWLEHAARDLAHYFLVKEKHPQTLSLFSDIHKTFYAFFELNMREQLTGDDLLHSSEMLPSFSSFTWEEILELRNGPSIRSCRRMLSDYLFDDTQNNTSIDKRISSILYDVVTEFEQNPRKSLVSETMIARSSTTPLSFLSPIRYLVNVFENKSKLGALFFLQNVKRP
ncbi:MAG: hypothetical protein ACXU9N_07020 [Syntrophales bacterium]